MNSILFHWGPLTIYTYGFFIGLAVIFAFWAGEQRSEDFGWESGVATNFVTLFAIGGILGARFLFVLEHFSDYRQGSLYEYMAVWHGGLSWFGGFCGAILAAMGYAKRKKIAFGRVADFIAPILAASHGIGRIGCYYNHCCEGLVGPVAGQLLEAFFLFLLSLFLFKMPVREKNSGRIFLAYVFFYSVERFVLESVRVERTVIGSFSLPQWFCLALILAASYVYLKKVRQHGKV